MDLREKLATELYPAPWSILAPQHARDVLFVVRAPLALLDVAVAVAEDRAADVQAWIESGQLARPTLEQAHAWASEEGSRFVIAIVQPVVLAQRIEGVGADAAVDSEA